LQFLVKRKKNKIVDNDDDDDDDSQDSGRLAAKNFIIRLLYKETYSIASRLSHTLTFFSFLNFPYRY